jgi:putative oxidoreductase
LLYDRSDERISVMSIDLALLMVRLIVGLTIAAHGAQKLFGWFGGPGLRGTSGWLASMGLRAASFWALMAGVSEFGGGVVLALGLLSPFGSLGIIAAMVMAIILAHWPRFFASNQGMEYPLVLLGGAVAAALSGSGTYSLDGLLGLTLPQPLTSLLGLILVMIGVMLPLASRVKPQVAHAEQS